MKTEQEYLYVFTLEDANRMLPLVTSVVSEIVEHYGALMELTDTSERFADAVGPKPSREQRFQLQDMETEMERHRQWIDSAVFELFTLGVELKDYELGIVDFPGRFGGDAVYLTWQLGEEEIKFWHSLESSYMDRQHIAFKDAAA
jgi:hypothetical protein